MKHLLSAFVLMAYGLAHAVPYLHGVTDKDPLSYAVGEDIVFTVSLEGAESFPDGVSATWRRSGDDGVEEKGTWDGRAPLSVKTKLKRAGFVRLTVEPRQTANGNPWRVKGACGDVFFDGGAGVGVNMLVQSKPEPKDFDAFWKTCRDELDAVPVKADLEEIPSPTKGVRLYKAKVTCPGGTGYSTGYLSVPVGAKKVKAAASFFGYQFSWTKGAYMPPSSVPTTEMRFYVSAHGFELGREPTYYQSFREAAGSNGFGHGFDPKQNAKPATCYFHGMALRVMRAVEYLKTRPEWNGRDLVVVGGSQGSLQAMWCAAFVPGVTEAQIFIPWLCDVGGTTDGRNHGDWFPEWAPGLDYFDQVNVAKRIPETCRVAISRIGLGDYIAPPCGAAMMYRSLKCPKSAVWMQGSTHGYVPPNPQTISWAADGRSPKTPLMLDTSLYAPPAAIDAMLPVTDLWLPDYKADDDDLHVKFTGVSNKVIRENLKCLVAAKANLEVRCLVVPNCTDGADLAARHSYLNEIGIPESSIVNLEYFDYARSKYLALGLPDTMPPK